MARGIRRITSKRAGSLELFNLVKVSAIPGRGNIDTLTEVQLQKPFSEWRTQMGRVNIAYQLVETIDKLTPDAQPHPHIFNILTLALSEIGNLGAHWQQTVDMWLVEILRDLGFWPENQEFTGNIYDFIEKTSERALNSPTLLRKLK
jgi:DNA repair protein RecO